MDDYGPLFNAQLEAVCSDFQVFGGRIGSLKVGKFETQVGPTCGLVSIRIAASALGCDNIPAINELLGYSQQQNYTRNGESFSVDWLANVVTRFLPTVRVEICKFPSANQLIETNLLGGIYLIPYDSDKNFGPCNNDGHNAHWFVLTGFLILDPDEQSIIKIEEVDINIKIEETHLYLIGYQGKSRHAGVWSYSQMHDSNSQLNEQSPKLLEDSILPEGGIKIGLKGRTIRIVPTNNRL